MANGDIDGDLPATYKSRQTSFDQTNLPAQYQTAGPVARASQQLAGQQPSLTQVGGGAQPATSLPQPAAPVTPAPASLTQVGASSQQAVSTNTSQPNIAQTAAPSFPGATQQAGQLPSLFDAGANAVSLAQPMTSFAPSTPANGTSATQAPPASPAPASAQSNQPQTAASSLNGFQPTGIGIGAQGGQIVGKVGADGVPSFSNDPSAQRDAAGRPTLNGFTGQSNFSVGAPGDAARAMAGYQQLHDMRQQWTNEDRLDNALAQNTRNNNFNVVHDSSRPLSLQDRQTDASLDQMRANSLQNVKMAQGVYDDSVQRLGAQQQQRQAASLNDLRVKATGPNATTQDRQAYLSAADPKGYLKMQTEAPQAAATLAKTQADTAATVQKTQQAALTQQQAAKAQVDQKANSIELAKEARDLADSIPKDGQFSKITGPVDARTMTLIPSSQDLVNKANRLQTLLTVDNLKLMSGVLTDKDVEFLGQVGSGLNIGENGIKGSEDGTRQRLADISKKLSTKIAEYEKSNPPAAASKASTRPSTPAVGAIEDGHVFLGGNPANPASWRAQ